MIRKAYVAGSFYPATKKDIINMFEDFERKIDKQEIKEKIEGINDIKAVISPHAGYIFSGIIAYHVYRIIYERYGKEGLEKIFLWGPSHYFSFYNYIQPFSLKKWETPLGIVEIKEVKGIIKEDTPFILEHCLEVQLPFLQYFFDNFNITPLLFGELENIGPLLKLKDDFDLIIVSSDLSHYLPYNKAKEVDLQTLMYIENLDIKNFIEKGECCGKSSILALMMIAKKENWKAKVIKYLNSGDTFGDKEKVVGYGGVMFYV